jgi:disulfide bond formation protein DsbB
MFKNLIEYFTYLPQKGRYWLLYCGIGLALLVTALYFQHVLEELPCVVCIQIRLWITLLILLALAGWFVRASQWVNVINLAIFLTAVGLVERSYLLLGTERGFIFSDCGFDLGLPAWFAVEENLPWLYLVETSCGYTPELFFGITMAESLMAMSVLFLVISFCVVLLSFKRMLTRY